MQHDIGLGYSTQEDLGVSSLHDEELVFSDAEISSLRSWTQEHAVQWTIQGEKDFHYKFLLIKSKPHIMYYKGNLNLLHQPILGIVGPRDPSGYATQILQQLFTYAQSYQLVTISGLAPGVDQLCHRLSLEHDIPTIAVLGGGLKYFLQSTDRALIDRIVEHGGLVISEFKLPMKPEKYTFPQRNRIIAGLSDVLFLPEAGANSGSLITANFALEMSKPVYGVPNSITAEKSKGLHELMAKGQIKMVLDMEQFLDSRFTKKEKYSSSPIREDLTVQEKKLLEAVAAQESCQLADLMGVEDISSQELITSLTFLEMKGYIYQEAPGVYKVAI
ncbi:MAG: DNA-processing protein DprA [Candidatus Absconditabacterales bacterium]